MKNTHCTQTQKRKERIALELISASVLGADVLLHYKNKPAPSAAAQDGKQQKKQVVE